MTSEMPVELISILTGSLASPQPSRNPRPSSHKAERGPKPRSSLRILPGCVSIEGRKVRSESSARGVSAGVVQEDGVQDGAERLFKAVCDPPPSPVQAFLQALSTPPGPPIKGQSRMHDVQHNHYGHSSLRLFQKVTGELTRPRLIVVLLLLISSLQAVALAAWSSAYTAYFPDSIIINVACLLVMAMAIVFVDCTPQ
ncbi:hypothetical protein DL95DRAFT_412863 [Leptodontidium sp. 2 PMI_412]|nr:hypothetical protein DL95DRAFT_412863 [Leptodontidium sp. 2 PMI_412]